MRKWICVLLAVVLCMGTMTAMAEAGSKLGDFSNRLKKNAEAAAAAAVQTETPAEEADNSFGPAVRVSDPFFAKVRSSAYLHETEYSREANVMIELKNVSGRTLYPDDVSITAYNAAGEVIEEETYSSYGPDMVDNGESLFVWDWFYGFDVPVAEISYFEVKIESETSSYNEYAKIDGQALVSEGIAYALVENTLENDIYGLSATIVMENNDGTLLDVTEVSVGNTCGIFPGSVMVLRDNAEDYANDGKLLEANASVHVLYRLD